MFRRLYGANYFQNVIIILSNHENSLIISLESYFLPKIHRSSLPKSN